MKSSIACGYRLDYKHRIYRQMLLVGLGNPGSQYKKTRHNIGQIIIDWLREDLVGVESQGFILEKNDTYMNNSGIAVKKLLDEYQLTPDNLVVTHDDVDVPLGEFKLQKGSGSAGHRGVSSIIHTIGTKEFWRVRVGIGRPPEGVETEEFVLEPLSSDELATLYGLTPKIMDYLYSIAKRKTRNQ